MAESTFPEQRVNPTQRRTWGVMCTAKRRSDGQPCTRYAIRGGTVCYNHGGQLPRVKAKAARVYAEWVGNAISTLEQLLEPFHEKKIRMRAARSILAGAGIRVYPDRDRSGMDDARVEAFLDDYVRERESA